MFRLVIKSNSHTLKRVFQQSILDNPKRIPYNNIMYLSSSNIEQLNQLSKMSTQRSVSDDELSNSSSNTSISELEDDFIEKHTPPPSSSISSSQLHRSSLEELLDLEQISDDTFVNKSELFIPYRGRGLFGGTMAAQSTLAALLFTNTAEKCWKPISLHCHFLFAAKPNPKLYYKVSSLKDGKNYCTRDVSLFQNDQLIYKAVISLQAYNLEGSASKMEGQLDHHRQAPIIGKDIEPPENMFTQEDVFKIWSKKAMNTKHLEYLKGPEAENEVIASYDREPCTWKLPLNMFDLDKVPNREKESLPSSRTLRYWAKNKQKLVDPKIFNWVAIAYISDYFYLSANMRMNLREMFTTKFSVSLDHIIYFNTEIDTSEFFSYNIRSLKSGENRTIMFGEMFSANGELAATTIQEGLSVVFTDI